MFAFSFDIVRIMATHEHPFMGMYSILIIYALLKCIEETGAYHYYFSILILF